MAADPEESLFKARLCSAHRLKKDQRAVVADLGPLSIGTSTSSRLVSGRRVTLGGGKNLVSVPQRDNKQVLKHSTEFVPARIDPETGDWGKRPARKKATNKTRDAA